MVAIMTLMQKRNSLSFWVGRLGFGLNVLHPYTSSMLDFFVGYSWYAGFWASSYSFKEDKSWHELNFGCFISHLFLSSAPAYQHHRHLSFFNLSQHFCKQGRGDWDCSLDILKVLIKKSFKTNSSLVFYDFSKELETWLTFLCKTPAVTPVSESVSDW